MKAVEDYHASYMSIHWWPRQLLDENREMIDQINRRMGYRIQLREASWPKRVRLGAQVNVVTRWANAGVAPCYPGGHPTITLKDEQGGIVSVHVDPALDVRQLAVEPRDPATEAKEDGAGHTLQSQLVFARRYVDGPRTFARAMKPGTYDLFVSIGLLDGTPRIALPLADDDGQRRYRLGQIQVE